MHLQEESTMPSFIEVYHNTIQPKDCQQIIHHFEQDPNHKIGGVGNARVDISVKDTTELNLFFTQDNQYNDLIVDSLNECIKQYDKTYPFLAQLSQWILAPGYNIQRYHDGQGYHRLHCEHEASGEASTRIMAWMIYLNDSPCGTEFPYQKITTNATEGDCLIWPAAWTHPHKGVTPNQGTKYIATGWIEFSKMNDILVAE